MSSRSIILLLATVLIPAVALTFVGVVLVRQQGELMDRRTEDQGRLLAREAADSLEALLAKKVTAVDPTSSARYPADNGILLLGRAENGRFLPPFPPVSSTLGEPAFQQIQSRLNRAGRRPGDYRRAAQAATNPDQKAFLYILEAQSKGSATAEALEITRTQDAFTDEIGMPLSLWAMQATGSIDPGFAPDNWLPFEAYYFAEDLGVSAFAGTEHALLRHVRDRFASIEGWRLSPDSTWLLARHDDAFMAVAVDSVIAWATTLPGVEKVERSASSQGFALSPAFPFLWAELDLNDPGSSQILWVLALALVLVVTTFASLLLFRDARRERRLADLRARFVSSVSHEVRTPLAAIRLYTDSLLAYGPGSDEEWRQDLETISYETDRLTRMLDNVLRVSRIERGTDRYHRSEGDLCVPVRKAIDAMMPAMKDAGCTVEPRLDTLPASFDGDAIEQAIVNLLSNASKYAPGSTVEVACGRENDHAFVSVSDNGPGMSAESRQHAFEPYFRGENGSTFNQTGTGLGLSLVRHIARGHDGDATVDSEEGRGSTFTITIPLAP